MIFALVDYYRYLRQTGRYGSNQKDGAMAIALKDDIPRQIVSQLRPGDAVFTQRLDSWKSWAMMYMTSSPIDHVAVYIGDDHVAHMTLEGSKKHSLRSLAKGARVVLARALPTEHGTPFDPPDGRGVIRPRDRPSHILPPKLQLVWVAIRIWNGFHPERFRWKFAVDSLVIGLVADAIIYGLTGMICALALSALSVAVMLANSVRFILKKIRNEEFELLSHPDIAYYGFFRNGGMFFSGVEDVGPLMVLPAIGILPLKAFLAMGRERPEDSATDKFQEFRQYVRNVTEYLDVGPGAKKAENDKS